MNFTFLSWQQNTVKYRWITFLSWQQNTVKYSWLTFLSWQQNTVKYSWRTFLDASLCENVFFFSHEFTGKLVFVYYTINCNFIFTVKENKIPATKKISSDGERERNVLFNDALNTFYLRLYSVRHMVKDHSDSERGNPLSPHMLLLSINSKGSFICTIPQTG